MLSRKSVGLSLLAWAVGMLGILGLNELFSFPSQFTIAHVIGAACVGSLVDYLLFCRRPAREVNVCERCFRSLKGMRPTAAVPGKLP